MVYEGIAIRKEIMSKAGFLLQFAFQTNFVNDLPWCMAGFIAPARLPTYG
jgi:hypothetical protein